MRNKDCSRYRAFMDELIDDWDKLNLAAKSLVMIGLILFICALVITLYGGINEGVAKSIEVVFRSSLASVFGFLLSSNMKKCGREKDRTLVRTTCSCGEEIEKYNYKDGNIVQIAIAVGISVISVIFILVVYMLDITHNIAALSQVRDLMCTSIGFLLGESKINP